MMFDRVKWNKLDYNELLEYMMSIQDIKYRYIRFILLFYLKCDIQTKHKCTIRRIYKFIETTRIYI